MLYVSITVYFNQQETTNSNLFSKRIKRTQRENDTAILCAVHTANG